MKKKYLRFLSLILCCLCIFCTACDSGGGAASSEETELDPSIMDSVNNADEIMKTKDNVTIYRDENGDDNGGYGTSCFTDAYIFVDPGADHEFKDLNGTPTPFKDLVSTQIETLAKSLSDSILSYYGEKENTLFLPYQVMEKNGTIDLTTIDAFSIIAGLETEPKIYSTAINFAAKDGTEINGNYFFLDLANAINGGRGIKTFVSEDETQKALLFENGVTVEDNESWLVTSGDLEEQLKYSVASALSGIAVTNDADFNKATTVIDHLGFTETDKRLISEKVMNNIVGTAALNQDENRKEVLYTYFASGGTSGQIDVAKVGTKIDELLTVEPEAGEYRDFQHYKGYSIVIPALIEAELNAEVNYGEEPEVDTGEEPETIKIPKYIQFPRIQMIVVDTNSLMDVSQEDYDDMYDPESGETPDVEEIPDGSETTLTEKLSQFVKVVGILFLPKQVNGTRTMAYKENDEWVLDQEGNPVLKDVEVTGFIMTDIEISLLSEPEKNAEVQAFTTVKYEGQTSELKAIGSEVMEVEYVKPEAEDENFTYVTTIVDEDEISKRDLITKEETEIAKYRMNGYNGISVDANGNITSKKDETLALTADKGSLGDYSTFTFGMNTFSIIKIADVNGDEGTSMTGYALDLSSFAGDNYVQTTFSIISVDGDDTNKDVKLNFLHILLEYV